METVVTLYDETLPGGRMPALRLSLLVSRITLRELIRRRIYEEVQQYHAAPADAPFHGLVTPSPMERLLNGDKATSHPKRRVDWEAQYEKALQAFQRNGFFVLVGDRQVDDIEEELELKVDTDIAFVKLVPLVGG